jgi:hypothetical protein
MGARRIALGLPLGLALGLASGCPQPGSPSPASTPPATPAPAATVLRLQRTGPRSALVLLGEERLGEFRVGPAGKVTGEALARVPVAARSMGRRVRIQAPDDLHPVVAEKLRALLERSGVAHVGT